MIYILLLIFLFAFMYFSNNVLETYSNSNTDNCNSFFDKDSLCALDIKNNKCTCRFQKDDNRYIFKSLDDCCKRNCEKLSAEECVSEESLTKMPYYCNIGGECKKYEGTIISSHISANQCGMDPLNNQLLLPYESLEQCSKSVNVCDKYNIPSQSVHVTKDNCLKDVNCGFCSNNDTDGGKCIEGTVSGPLDLQKYYYCTPDAKNSENKYTYGDHAIY